MGPKIDFIFDRFFDGVWVAKWEQKTVPKKKIIGPTKETADYRSAIEMARGGVGEVGGEARGRPKEEGYRKAVASGGWQEPRSATTSRNATVVSAWGA